MIAAVDDDDIILSEENNEIRGYIDNDMMLQYSREDYYIFGANERQFAPRSMGCVGQPPY